MRERGYLRSILTGESRAYGFTIAFWGSGATLIKANGLPEIQQALLYGVGAVLGFGVLTLAVLREEEESSPGNESYLILGALHYIASLVPITLVYLAVNSGIPELSQFLLSGLIVSFTYNILAVLEGDIAEFIESHISL
jgi:hypothetical protein